MNTFAEVVDTLVPRNVRAVLAGDSAIAAFFGASSIRCYQYAELAGPTRGPFLGVFPGEITDKPQLSGQATAVYPIDIRAFLPRQSPADDALTVPSAPTAAAGTTGLLSVTRRYGVSFYTATGESYCSNLSAPVTVTSKRINVTIPVGPAGTVGRRLWATESGRTAPRHLALVPDNTTTVYVDERPDAYLGAELAPDPQGYRKIFGAIKKLLRSEQTVQDVISGTGYEQCDCLLETEDQKPTINQDRNQLAWSIRANFHLYYSTITRESSVEHT